MGVRIGLTAVLLFAGMVSIGATDRVRGADDGKLDARDRQRVVDGVIANLKAHYFDRDVGQRMADAVAAHLKDGDDNGATDGGMFAGLLT